MNLSSKIEFPFLKQCVGYLGEVLGAGAMSAFYDRFHETVEIPWFPEFKNGLPFFDVERGLWEFSTVSGDSENLSLTISNTGKLSIRPGDDCGVYLELAISNPVEIAEILELHSKLTPENCTRCSFQSVPWSNIIQDVFLLLPNGGKNQLVRLNWADFQKDWKELWGALLMPIHYFYWGERNLIPGEEFLDAYSDWESWIKQCSSDKQLVTHGELKEDDLLYSPSEKLHSARTVLGKEGRQRYWEPKLAFRLQSHQSRTYFSSFISHAKEAEGFLTDLTIHHLEGLKQYLKQNTVSYPSNRLMQIRLATELRAARLSYEKKINSLMEEREPAAEMTSLYVRRNRHVKALHSEYLTEIEGHLHPLPFMIEWPLRRYQRADDTLLKIKCGQQLLTLLSKLPTFLVLEELHASDHFRPLVKPIEEKIFGKPASDGTLLECQRDLLKLIADQQISLAWFGRLLDQFGSEGIARLGKIVTARNRFHHPPHDESEMLAALAAEIPAVIKIMRETMEGLRCFTPDSMSFKEGKRIISGRRLMGFESDFPKEEFETVAPFESFPAGEIVVVTPDNSRALPLGRFFKRQTFKSVAMDIGLFDRMVGGSPEFVYLRNLEGLVV